jgi:hypothetical protein
MAKRKDIDVTGGEGVAGPQAAPEQVPAIDSIKAAPEPGLPLVESPSILPAVSEPVAISEAPIEPKPEPEVEAAKSAPVLALVHVPQPTAEAAADASVETAKPRFVLKARHKRYARLAASVALGAALGAIVGALGSGGFATAPRSNIAALEDNNSMQQSVALLAQEVTTLKASLEAANKASQVQVTKNGERLQKEAAEITGSISAPLPRPAPRIAMAESPPPARPPVVQGWSIRDTRGGYVYVEGHGDIYQILPGASLPGLGPVQSIKRLDGRWVVTTPRGIIVSMRDRRYFK